MTSAVALETGMAALAITTRQEQLQSVLQGDIGYKALDGRIQEAVQLLLRRNATTIFQVMQQVVGRPVPDQTRAAKAAKLVARITAQFKKRDDSEIAVKAGTIQSSAPLFQEKPALANLVAAYATPVTSSIEATYTSFKWVFKAHWVADQPDSHSQDELHALANTLNDFIVQVPFGELRAVLFDLIQHAKKENSFGGLCSRFLQHFFPEKFLDGLDTVVAYYQKEHESGRLDVESIKEFEDLVFDILRESAPYPLQSGELIERFKVVFAMRDEDTRQVRWDEIEKIFLELGKLKAEAPQPEQIITQADAPCRSETITTIKAVSLILAAFFMLWQYHSKCQLI